MDEVAHLTVVCAILTALLVLSVIGFFTVSPVLGIFVIVFAFASGLVLHELRNLRRW